MNIKEVISAFKENGDLAGNFEQFKEKALPSLDAKIARAYQRARKFEGFSAMVFFTENVGNSYSSTEGLEQSLTGRVSSYPKNLSICEIIASIFRAIFCCFFCGGDTGEKKEPIHLLLAKKEGKYHYRVEVMVNSEGEVIHLGKAKVNVDKLVRAREKVAKAKRKELRRERKAEELRQAREREEIELAKQAEEAEKTRKLQQQERVEKAKQARLEKHAKQAAAAREAQLAKEQKAAALKVNVRQAISTLVEHPNRTTKLIFRMIDLLEEAVQLEIPEAQAKLKAVHESLEGLVEKENSDSLGVVKRCLNQGKLSIHPDKAARVFSNLLEKLLSIKAEAMKDLFGRYDAVYKSFQKLL